MFKRGQIALFIVLAVIVVLLAAVLVWLPSRKQQNLTPPDLRPLIQNMASACLNQLLQNGLHILGMQGGYVYPEQFPGFSPYSGWKVEYDYFRGYTFLPTIADMEENQLAPYIKDHINKCTNSYKDVSASARKIQVGIPRAKVSIRENDVTAVLVQPVMITDLKGGTSVVDTFTATVPLHLPALRNEAQRLIDLQINDPAHISLSALSNSPYSPIVVPLSSDVTVTILKDSSTILRGKPYTFMYAALFAANMPPELLLPQEIRLNSGGTFRLEASDPNGDPLILSSNSDQFPVSKDGIVRANAPTGRYTVTFFAFDPQDLFDTQTVEVVVA